MVVSFADKDSYVSHISNERLRIIFNVKFFVVVSSHDLILAASSI